MHVLPGGWSRRVTVELAVGLGPLIRVNGIAPATVVAGSSMFPRDRVIGSLTNDSGPVMFEIGFLMLLMATGYARSKPVPARVPVARPRLPIGG